MMKSRYSAALSVALALSAFASVAKADRGAVMAAPNTLVLAGYSSNTYTGPAGIPVEFDTELPFDREATRHWSLSDMPELLEKQDAMRLLVVCVADQKSAVGTSMEVHALRDGWTPRYGVLFSQPLGCQEGIEASVSTAASVNGKEGRLPVYRREGFSSELLSHYLKGAQDVLSTKGLLTGTMRPLTWAPYKAIRLKVTPLPRSYQTLLVGHVTQRLGNQPPVMDADIVPDWVTVGSSTIPVEKASGLPLSVDATEGLEALLSKRYGPSWQFGTFLSQIEVACRPGPGGLTNMHLKVEFFGLPNDEREPQYATQVLPGECKPGPLLNMRLKMRYITGHARKTGNSYLRHFVFLDHSLSSKAALELLESKVLPAADKHRGYNPRFR